MRDVPGNTIAIQGAVRRQGPGAMGVTLVESLLATVVLSIVVLGIVYAMTAGHQHLHVGDTILRAVRLAEHLMEEIQSRPYSGSGADRSSYHVDDYDGFQEVPGELTDFQGSLYAGDDQVFSRSVGITTTSHTISDLEAFVVSGKTVMITAQDAKGAHCVLTRFVPEPASP